MKTVRRSQPQGPSTAVGWTAGPGRGSLPSGSGPAVRSSSRALLALVVTTIATAVVVATDSSSSSGVHLVVVALACGAYLVLITDRRPSGLSVRVVSVAVAVQTFVALARPPAATQDLWYYAIYGRMVAAYHASPYTHVPADFPHNPFLADVGRAWHHTPSVYGPVFTALSSAASFVFGSSYDGTRLFYQGLAAAALFGACVIVWHRTRSADAVAFLALNPVTALYLVNGGRNDILVGLALLGAVVLATRGHDTAAGVVGGLGALVKLTGMVGVVALVVALVVAQRRQAARRVGVTAGLTVVGAYLIAGTAAVLTPMDTAGALYSRISVWRLLPQLGRELPSTQLALAITGIVVCFVLLRSAHSGPEVAVPATTTALTLGAAYTLPGYAGWALPTAALRHREPFARVAAYQAVALVAAYEVVRHPLPGRLGNDLSQFVELAGPLLVVFLLARLAVCARRRPGGDDVQPAPPRAGARGVNEAISSVLVVVPTLNERENIERLLVGIRTAAPAVDVLVVDDASPDGTADIAESLGRSLGSIRVVRREGEPGLGAAYRDGFRYGLVQGYDVIVEMDADLSHDPAVIPALVDALSGGTDLAIGARYVNGGATPGWPLHRRLLSRIGGEYARVLLGLPSHDPTSGFRAFRAELLHDCELATVGAQGFAFQLEMLHRASRLGARVVEVPIVFRDRTAGESKLSGAIAQEALRLVTARRRRPWHPATHSAASA